MKRMRQFAAWGLFGAALYLALAFTTYYPYDGAFAPRPVNLGGAFGRWLSARFVDSFGVGAYVLAFWLVFVGYQLLSGRKTRVHSFKLVGLFTCMLTFGTFCQSALPTRDFPAGNVPLGGLLGFQIVDALHPFWGRSWTLVTMGLGVLTGFLLMTESRIPTMLARPRKQSTMTSEATSADARAEKRRKLAEALAAANSSDSASTAESGNDRKKSKNRLTSERSGSGEPADSFRGLNVGDDPDLQKIHALSDRESGDEDAENIALFDREDAAFAAARSQAGAGEESIDDEAAMAFDAGPLAEEEAADAPVPAIVNPPTIRAAAAPILREGIEVIRLAPDPKLRGKEKYELPPLSLLAEPKYLEERETDLEIQAKAVALEQALLDYGVTAKVEEIERGPVITRFDVSIARGTKITKVTSLGDELAMALGVSRVRIAPVKGRPVLGVEIPNRERETVFLKEIVLATDLRKRKCVIPLFLGKDAAGNPVVEDLATTPHLLIAGRTGAGKSVFVNNLIVSILLTRYPEEVRLIMIDPKKVELEVYQDIPHLLTKVESNPKKAMKILEWAVNQMEERYEILAATGQRHVSTYNKLPPAVREERLQKLYSNEEIAKIPAHLPYIVIIVDELADLMMVAGKDVETSIARLAQKARAVGIHVVLATQRPSIDVITGLIKSNLPARIAFQTRVGVDSRTILDRYGAEKLLDKGDMLYLSATSDDPRRIQGPFISDEEVEKVVAYLREKASPMYTHHLEQVAPTSTPEASIADRDELFEAAVDCVMNSGQASASHLQTRMNVGYARARRLVEMMGEAGFVGQAQGAKPREILLTPERWEEIRAKFASGSSTRRSAGEVMSASSGED